MMQKKIQKIFSFLKIISHQPSLINLILNDNSVFKRKFIQKYHNFHSLPQIDISDLKNEAIDFDIDTFFLDGGSMVTDLQLLMVLASRNNARSYFEIGTWRGESVWNVAKILDDCTTFNLSEEEITSLFGNSAYAKQHGILSKKNERILHLTGNTENFDFKKLDKKYDLIFIDGDHSYEMVLNDTKKVFENLVHENSVVVWHDYAYNPQSIRYEVFSAILDGIPKKYHENIYHVKNTMCAIFIRENFKSTEFKGFENPQKLFSVKVSENRF